MERGAGHESDSEAYVLHTLLIWFSNQYLVLTIAKVASSPIFSNIWSFGTKSWVIFREHIVGLTCEVVY